MKNISLTVLSLLTLLVTYPLAEAQKPIAKEKALNVLMRTNRVIGFGHMAVKRGHVYTGDLAKAVRHERFAKKLYLEGMYHKAILHSRRARLLAMEAIKANRVKPTSDCSVTTEENEMMGNSVSDQDLDKELDDSKAPELKDEDLINNNNLDIDIK